MRHGITDAQQRWDVAGRLRRHGPSPSHPTSSDSSALRLCDLERDRCHLVRPRWRGPSDPWRRPRRDAGPPTTRPRRSRGGGLSVPPGGPTAVKLDLMTGGCSSGPPRSWPATPATPGSPAWSSRRAGAPPTCPAPRPPSPPTSTSSPASPWRAPAAPWSLPRSRGSWPTPATVGSGLASARRSAPTSNAATAPPPTHPVPACATLSSPCGGASTPSAPALPSTTTAPTTTSRSCPACGRPDPSTPPTP